MCCFLNINIYRGRYMSPKVTHRSGEIDLSKKVITTGEFATRVYTLMYEKGWNQSELARKSEIGRDSISTYINGKSVPTPRNLEKLSLALGTEPEKLYPNYDEANNKQSDKMESFNKIDDGSGMYWVYVNRKLDGNKAIKIMQLLNEIED